MNYYLNDITKPFDSIGRMAERQKMNELHKMAYEGDWSPRKSMPAKVMDEPWTAPVWKTLDRELRRSQAQLAGIEGVAIVEEGAPMYRLYFAKPGVFGKVDRLVHKELLIDNTKRTWTQYEIIWAKAFYQKRLSDRMVKNLDYFTVDQNPYKGITKVQQWRYEFTLSGYPPKFTKGWTATAYCRPDNEWNSDIGIMVALHKMFKIELPEWIRPHRHGNKVL